MAGEDQDAHPLSDGELSFSRWRSSSFAESRVRSHAPSADEPVLDFQQQFARRDEDESGSASTSHGDKKGVDITISTDPGVSCPDSSHSVSDREFGFALHSSAVQKPDLRENLVDGHRLTSTSSHSISSVHGNGVHKYHELENEERESQGSSELSLQDLVERQDDDLISSRKSVLVALFGTLFYILIWYFFSTGLTIYNKRLLGAKLWDFPAPLLMNTVHFSLQAIISWLALRFFLPSMQPARSISWRDYIVKVVPTAIATALDIDFTNASLVFISISFETMELLFFVGQHFSKLYLHFSNDQG